MPNRDLQADMLEAEEQFRTICDLLKPLIDKGAPLQVTHAHTLAWRMHMRLEEHRNRHPY